MNFFTQIVVGMLFLTAISASGEFSIGQFTNSALYFIKNVLVLPETRVVNGTEAPLGKYPSMVNIRTQFKSLANKISPHNLSGFPAILRWSQLRRFHSERELFLDGRALRHWVLKFTFSNCLWR
jgi:hypothetical protein